MAIELQKSGEDYLETMLMLKEKNGYIRSVDISRHLGVSKPSVSYATKRLRENGYIDMNDDGLIILTELGMSVAQKIYSRHKMLMKFLVMLGVDEETAEDDACKIEHDISAKTFDALCDHVNNFMMGCPRIIDKSAPCPEEK